MLSQSDHGPKIDLAPGAPLQGRYRLGRELARRPAVTVYLAQDHHQGDEAAIKVLSLPPTDRTRLRHEVMAAWEVSHDHIVGVRSYFESHECSFVAMDYVEGPSLLARVAEGPLTPDEVAAIGRGIALALQAAHRRGVLHRHVTPGNVLIAPEVRAHLADFGSAGFGHGAESREWRDFAAPEVHGGQAADPRSDIYGLGLCLFLALTGRLPERQSPEGRPRSTADGHRPSTLRPTVPSWLDDAVARATAALPADRFASAGRLADALAPGAGRPSLITVRA